MRVDALARLCLAAAVAVAPLACASGPRFAGTTVHAPGGAGHGRTREQVLNRDKALIAGLATSLAFGLVGLGTLLANANFSGPRESVPMQEMPRTIAIAGGIMSLGMLAAIPFGVAVDRHRHRHPEVFVPRRGPRATASLSPTALLRPAPLVP